MKKNSFLVFLFSLLPGAGEMYLGMMKTGIVLMSAFFGVIFIGNILNIEILLFALPVIWCYSFFHVHNVKMLFPEALKQMDDKTFMGFTGFFEGKWPEIFAKRHAILGGVLIFVGVATLFQTFMRPYIYLFEDTLPSLYVLLRNIPTLIVALAIIILGVMLLRGKKAAPPAPAPDEDITEFGGKHNEQ